MKTERIRFFALLLAVLLMVAMLPVTAFAAEGDDVLDLTSYELKDTNNKTKTTFSPGNIIQLTLEFDISEDINVENIDLDRSNLILSGSNFIGVERVVDGRKTSYVESKIIYKLRDILTTSGSTTPESLTFYLKVNSNLDTGTY